MGDAAGPLKVGQRISAHGACTAVKHFEKLGRVGEGTYGVVYKARRKGSGELCALKRLKADMGSGGFALSNLREVALLRAAAGHPNVLAIRDVVVGHELSAVFIALELCAQDLARLLDILPIPLEQPHVKCIMLHLLRGLEHLHGLGIMHRDIKPSNLLLDGEGVLKIGDFGLARRVREEEGGEADAPLSPTVVTLWYRSPELLLGCEVYGCAIDCWAAGCVLGELIRHKPLFAGRSVLRLQGELLGLPSESIWPGFSRLPGASDVLRGRAGDQHFSTIKEQMPYLSERGVQLVRRLLTYDPGGRITASEALLSPWWAEEPWPSTPARLPLLAAASQ